MIDIVRGTDWSMVIELAVPSGLTDGQFVTELSGATAAATIEDVSTGTTKATALAIVDGPNKKIELSMTAAVTTALTKQLGGLMLDLRYTTTASVVRAVRLSEEFRVLDNPWE